MREARDKRQPLFMISVVSRMLGVHPQTLRLYEREGLVTPCRTKRSRLYSQEDVEKIEMILRLTRELGVNRAGVDVILRLRHRLEVLQKEMDEMMQFLEDDLRSSFRKRLSKLFSKD
jgi:MerR family transcriptional regulator/heat shock protein HspR